MVTVIVLICNQTWQTSLYKLTVEDVKPTCGLGVLLWWPGLSFSGTLFGGNSARGSKWSFAFYEQ